MRFIGRITKWVGERGWGVCNSYNRSENGLPERFFVHINNAVNNEIQLSVGTRITFEVGPPRHEGEMSVARAIELAPPLHYKNSISPTGDAAPVDPSPVTNDGKGGVR